MDNFYREEILEHYRNPLNKGKLSKFNVSSKQVNPFCGDEIEVFIKFEAQPLGLKAIGLKAKVKKISFEGRGCAICIASASILTEYAKRKTKNQLTNLNEKDMLRLLKIELSPTRKKCALLGLAVLKDCIK